MNVLHYIRKKYNEYTVDDWISSLRWKISSNLRKSFLRESNTVYFQSLVDFLGDLCQDILAYIWDDWFYLKETQFFSKKNWFATKKSTENGFNLKETWRI